jgi:hypothetical protein
MNHALIFNVHEMGNRRPVGVHRIASFLRENSWDVEVIDWAAYWDLDQLKELCRSRITSDTVFCGFGCFWGLWNDKFETLGAWIKQTWPHIKHVYGSNTHPRLSSKIIDYYVLGYGEKAILEIVKSLTGNTDTKLAFDPVFFGSKKLISANDSYPAFPMRSLKVIYEDRDYVLPHEWLTTELARGCKFSCKFCNYPILGVKADHSRDAEDFEIQMRDAYDRFGVTNYYISDETINESTERLNKYADVVERLNFTPLYYGFIRADLMVSDPEQIEAMARMRMLGHYYGVETMNHPTGKIIGKGMNPDKLMPGILNAKNTLSAVGPYRGTISLICGLPHETVDTWSRGVQWCKDNWAGEGINLFALDITTDPMDSKLSYISQNYEKLGYRKSTVPLQDFNNPDMKAEYGQVLLNWENDHMNLSSAIRLVEEGYDLLGSQMGVNTWSISDYSLTRGPEETIKIAATTQVPTEAIDNLHRTYIEKKLR